jgi:NAD(P)-dependent dehydrogenase (short-subunit alcohol dehydrogenase family)
VNQMRTAWVTGAGKGIGASIARAFGQAGLRVAISARTQPDIDRVSAEIRAAGAEAIALVCDMTDSEAVHKTAAAIQTRLGPIEILVNNAGAADSQKFLGHDDQLWHRMIDVNLNSVYYACKAVAPMMVTAGWGRIINIASIASKVGGKYIAAYTASKHGVLGLTRALATELVPHQITVNAICPAYVDTPMTDHAVATIVSRTRLDAAQARATLEKMSPQNRLMAPGEIAHVALMLIAEEARGITGQSINVDGGMVMF